MANKDYILDENGDLLIKNGDFVVGLSDDQHIEDIITSFQGEYKEFPFTGAGILTSLNASDARNAINKVKEQLQAAGYSLTLLNIYVDKSGKLRIEFPLGITNNG